MLCRVWEWAALAFIILFFAAAIAGLVVLVLTFPVYGIFAVALVIPPVYYTVREVRRMIARKRERF